MITNIQLEKVVVANGVLFSKTYTPIDITNQLEMPILDTAQLNNVLDTTQITLINKDKRPLKPFTRMVLRLTDTTDGSSETEHIYRLVENDVVTNVVMGNKPLYRHSISLIEITKQLERVAVDNLTFTNYLDDNYGSGNTLAYNRNQWTMGGFSAWNNHFVGATILQEYYINGNRFTGPYRMLYLSGYEVVDSATEGALLVVSNDTPTEIVEGIEEGDLFNPATQIMLKDVTPTQQSISIGDYVKFIDYTAQNTISTNIGFAMQVRYSTMNITKWFKAYQYRDLSLKEYRVTKPNGATQNLTLNGTFTFDQFGTYKFFQRYEYRNENNVIMCWREFTWELNTVASVESMPQRYTIKDVINRLLSVCEIRRKVAKETQRFVLDETITDKLMLLSPEFSFTQGTLFEALQQIGEYIHAIPRLIPKVEYEHEYDANGNVATTTRNDYTDWNIVTFDFLGGVETYNNDSYSLIDLEHPMEDFATNFVSNVQNATTSNYNNETTVIEPFNGGYVSTRTDAANFEINNDSAIIKTKYPIRSIISVRVYTGGKVKDITAHIVEKAKFETRYTYANATDIYNNKGFFLYYTEGERNINNLSYLRPNANFLGALSNQEAIKNILSLDATLPIETYIKNMAVQIEYIPFQDFKVRQYKTLVETTAEESSLFYNQQSNEVDVDAYGKAINYALLKVGNEKITKTQYFNSLQKAPRCGLLQNQYYAYIVNREIGFNIPIKATTQWSKNYNEMYAYNGIKKNVRQYEISEKESTLRNLDYQEFCFVDVVDDVEDIFADSTQTELQNFIKESLAHIGFASNKLLDLIANKLKNNNSAIQSLTYAIVKTIATNREGKEEKHCFLLPIECFAFGKSVVLHLQADDNYSAGTYAINAKDVDNPSLEDKVLNSYAVEDYVRYSNEFGRFDTMGVYFGCVNPLKTFDISSASKYLYKVDESNINVESAVIDFMNQPFIVDKDSREQISLTTQLNFVTTNPDVLIGNQLVQMFPFTTEKQPTYKFVYFTKMPNKFEDVVDGETFYSMGKPQVEKPDYERKTIKIIPPTSCINACGYGIIDNNNRLCVYINKAVKVDETPKPILLMFRSRV